MDETTASTRGVWLAVILLAGLFAAAIAFAVFRAVGADLPLSLTAGGATFLGLTSLGLTTHRFLTE
ncbi:hypothetical protein [Streptomyces griseocarneus]|uniref:hypothetical protein n=1 Tax=Streptomyces griseocarneus TaxID=51201 RepID=UPI00167EEE8D|nr:hypothetical protein [Streptomyces griseocarneus]MBZ6474374.1 hypothetical protein [Streptomyces griseocarneus]GHG68603.1 hypothetical protein GCM10018779_41560 [Streptomyces griseocarneus]